MTASPIVTAAPTPVTDAQLQAKLDALRAAGDCAGIVAMDVTNAGWEVSADHEDAVFTCNEVGVVYPTAGPPKTVTVKGRGSQNSKPFNLGVGDYSVIIKGSGSGNVAVVLKTVSKKYVELLVNEISRGGTYSYETQLYGEGCSSTSVCYYLDATMPSRAWTVTFTPIE